MFLKKCRILELDPAVEFFYLAGKLYNPHKYENNGLKVFEGVYIDLIYYKIKNVIIFILVYLNNITYFFQTKKVTLNKKKSILSYF